MKAISCERLIIVSEQNQANFCSRGNSFISSNESQFEDKFSIFRLVYSFSIWIELITKLKNVTKTAIFDRYKLEYCNTCQISFSTFSFFIFLFITIYLYCQFYFTFVEWMARDDYSSLICQIINKNCRHVFTDIPGSNSWINQGRSLSLPTLLKPVRCLGGAGKRFWLKHDKILNILTAKKNIYHI